MTIANTQFKLSQIVQIVNRTFDEVFAENEFLFTAEILKINIISAKVYLELVEFHDNKIMAKSRAIIYNIAIYSEFIEYTKLETTKGLNILFSGKVTFHNEYGFSIKITKIHSEYIIGQLVKKEQTILDQLSKEGILNQNKQTIVGLPPYRIAVISSENSQGFEDFRAIIDKSTYIVDYNLYPTHIHGNIAIQSVHNSLRQIYMDIKSGINYNLVAIIRGGGGSSGISRQNDINIAKGICHMQVPVMLAVGHTSDQFVLDKIAKYAMKTPSDAAHFIINHMDILNDKISALYISITNIIIIKKQTYKSNIENIYIFITNKIINQKSHIINNIYLYHKTIKSFDLGFMTSRGFALVKKENKYISKKTASDLKLSDKLELYIYDKKIIVIIENIF